jgi:hypothetical protein
MKLGLLIVLLPHVLRDFWITLYYFNGLLNCISLHPTEVSSSYYCHGNLKSHITCTSPSSVFLNRQ